MRTPAIGRRDSDLVWPAAIDRGGSQLAFPAAHGASPIDSMFSFCSISEARRECIERPQPCLKRRSTRGFARYADREHVSGGRNRTIDRSNINGLRAGSDAQGTSAGEEDLEVDVADGVRSGRLEL